MHYFVQVGEIHAISRGQTPYLQRPKGTYPPGHKFGCFETISTLKALNNLAKNFGQKF